MTAPDLNPRHHRHVLDNPGIGWPAETVSWAEGIRDADLRARRPDDPGTAPDLPALPQWPDFDATILRAPVRPVPPGAWPAVAVSALSVLAGVLITAGAIVLIGWLP